MRIPTAELVGAVLLLLSTAPAQTSPSACWPLQPIPPANAFWNTPTLPYWEMRIETTNPLEPDHQWAHIHAPPAPAGDDRSTVKIAWQAFSGVTDRRGDLEVRYLVDGQPVSGWLASSGAPHDFAFTIDVCQFLPNPPATCTGPAVLSLFPNDGVFDLTCEIRWSAASTLPASQLDEYFPIPAYLHLNRKDQAAYPIRQDSPLTNTAVLPNYARRVYGPLVERVSPSQRVAHDHPLDPTVTRASISAFVDAPMHAQSVEYFVDRVNAHADLFRPYFMWWQHNATAPFPSFARALAISHISDARSLLVFNADSPKDHRKLPAIDGPRGTGFVTGYISGQFDSVGNFYFAETSGRIGRISPDGTILTLSGFRVQSGNDPVWWQKARARVHDLQNVEFRGSWPASVPYGGAATRQYPGMRLPLDVAIDADNQNVLYIAAYYDHAIYRVDATDPENAVVEVLAGDPNTTIVGTQQRPRGGFRDGTGSSALFDGPSSLVFDADRDVLYVADQNNHAIREVDRAGNVTTILGGRNGLDPVTGPFVPTGTAPTNPGPLFGISDYFDSYVARTDPGAEFVVTGTQAQGGTRPSIFLPQTVRLDSQGRLLVNEIGFGSIRRIVVDPAASDFAATDHVADIFQAHTSGSRGWAWFDVDRFGAVGPTDTIYYGSLNTGIPRVPGSVTNETWLWVPPDGNPAVPVTASGQTYLVRAAQPIFGKSNGAPVGAGRLQAADGGHYPWVVAVDPRGGLLTGGIGEFGLSRIRPIRADEQAEFPANATSVAYADYREGRELVQQGGTSTPAAGCPAPHTRWSTSAEMRLGFDGHGLLGIEDAWQFPTRDPSITAAARRTVLPTAVTSSMTGAELAQVDRFLRWSAWDVATGPVAGPAMEFVVVGNGTTVLGTGKNGDSIVATLGTTTTLDFGVTVPRAVASTVADFDVVVGGTTLPMSIANTPLLDPAGEPLRLDDGSLVYHLAPTAIPVTPGGPPSTFQFAVRARASTAIPGVSPDLDALTVQVTFQ